MKDWCTWFPDNWAGKYIGDCCKGHDEDCNTTDFFICLKDRIGTFHALYISAGGTVGCIVKYFRA